jgi:O-antigen/teichoic acid export membrane protein
VKVVRSPWRKAPTLELNATALMASTGLAAVFGALFWLLAARMFSLEAVGRASAAFSAITLLAGLSQLNIISLFVQFLPITGAGTARFIRRGYGATMAISGILATGFVILGFARNFASDAYLLAAFVAITAVNALFVVQDGALSGLRRAFWVPIENLATGIVRVLLLLLFVSIDPERGILLAIGISMLASVAAVNLLIFRRLVPQHLGDVDKVHHRVRLVDIKGFVALDYISNALSSGIALVPPVLVAAVLGAEASAYFYMPWFIGLSLSTLLWNIVMSFVVESVNEPRQAQELFRRAVRLVAVVVAAGSLVTLLGAPLLLAALGSSYSAEASTALRIIGASLPFSAAIFIYHATALVGRRLQTLVIVQAIKAILFFAASTWLLRAFGINGIALAYAGLEAIAAIILFPKILRAYRTLVHPGHVEPGGTETERRLTMRETCPTAAETTS